MVVNTGTRLFDMLNDEVMTDVTFVVQGTEIKGHRVVASSQGGVLRELLENCKDNRVEISQDIAPHTFKTVLQYLYTDTCEVNGLNLFDVIHAAKTFGLDGLEGQCGTTVKGKLSPTNIAAFTSQALLFNAEEYTKACQDYFRKHTLEVIKSKDFLEFPIKVLLVLCSSERITCSELEVFLACVEWAKNECQRQKKKCTPEKLRAVLGEVLSKIRFPCIAKKDFEDVVLPLDILTAEEVGGIVFGWTKKEKKTQYSDTSRTENASIKVTVQDYRGRTDSSYEVCEIPSVPLSTRISKLKAMKVFRGHTQGYRNISSYRCTLFHKGLELADDMDLASIYTQGEDLVLKIAVDISVDVTVRDFRDGSSTNYTSQDYQMSAVPLSTSVSELKEMELICDAKYNGPEYTFILFHKGKELADDVTLASIHTPGEQMLLDISLAMTTAVTVRDHRRALDGRAHNDDRAHRNVRHNGDRAHRNVRHNGDRAHHNVRHNHDNGDRAHHNVRSPPRGRDQRDARALHDDRACREYRTWHGSYDRVYRNDKDDQDADFGDSILPAVPLSMRISKLKTMDIFHGCSQKFPADTFTFSLKGKELADDVTLASIHTPGEGLVLEVHSVTFTVRGVGQGGWELPVPIKVIDLKEKGANIVKEHIYIHKNVRPVRVMALTGAVSSRQFPHYENVYPGAVIIA